MNNCQHPLKNVNWLGYEIWECDICKELFIRDKKIVQPNRLEFLAMLGFPQPQADPFANNED